MDPDPGFGALFRPLDLGSGMGKKTGSGLNNTDHISESLETIFWIIILKHSLMRIRDPGWKKIRIRDTGKKIRIRDPQHCCEYTMQYRYCSSTVPYPRVRASIRHGVWRAGQPSTQRRMSGAPGRAWKIIKKIWCFCGRDLGFLLNMNPDLGHGF
jgi:hypothetical protein